MPKLSGGRRASRLVVVRSGGRNSRYVCSRAMVRRRAPPTNQSTALSTDPGGWSQRGFVPRPHLQAIASLGISWALRDDPPSVSSDGAYDRMWQLIHFPTVKFFHLLRGPRAEVRRVVEFVDEHPPVQRPVWFIIQFLGQTKTARSITLVFPNTVLKNGNSVRHRTFGCNYLGFIPFPCSIPFAIDH
jgi:hypothetical protein